MDILNFIPKSLYILVIALWVLGYMIKQAKFIKDALIPFILTAISIIFVLILQGVSAMSVLQGIICAAFAVYGKNIVSQVGELFEGSKPEGEKVA